MVDGSTACQAEVRRQQPPSSSPQAAAPKQKPPSSSPRAAAAGSSRGQQPRAAAAGSSPRAAVRMCRGSLHEQEACTGHEQEACTGHACFAHPPASGAKGSDPTRSRVGRQLSKIRNGRVKCLR